MEKRRNLKEKYMKKVLGWLGALALGASSLPQFLAYKEILGVLGAVLMGGAHQAPPPK